MEKRRARRIVGLITVASLGLAACGSSGSSSTEVTHESNQDNSITYKYFDNGTRTINFSDDYYATILDFCDGPDLVEQTKWDSHAGNNVTRSVDHPACKDGRLDPEDFPSQN